MPVETLLQYAVEGLLLAGGIALGAFAWLMTVMLEAQEEGSSEEGNQACSSSPALLKKLKVAFGASAGVLTAYSAVLLLVWKIVVGLYD